MSTKTKAMRAAAMALAVAGVAGAETLPKATEVYAKMGLGWNIGNTMEAPGGPTTWGNPFPTKELLDSVKAAGFNTVRIPTAWYTHADTATNTIRASWMDSVKTVVDHCVDNGLYCILNIHWDSGWLENNVFAGKHPVSDVDSAVTDTAKVIARQKAFWTQIATTFKDYNEHLLFAGLNEPGVNDPWLTQPDGKTKLQVDFNKARAGILKAYEQTFIDAVRATGGNNETRSLIVQAPRTDIDFAETLLKDNMPTDPTGAGYLMAEVHFYPWQFALMTKDEDWGKQFFYWDGHLSGTDTTHNVGWNVYAQERTGYGSGAWVDSLFGLMKTGFYDKGIPVVLGEFGAVKRLSQLSGEDLRLHLLSRAAFYGKVAAASKANGLVPVAWDHGGEDDMNMTLIRRQKGAKGIFDYETLNAMRKAYGLDTLAGNSIDALVNASSDTTNKSLQVTYTPTDTGATGTIRITPTVTNWANYTGLVVRAQVTGTAGQTTEGDYGWYSVDLATMSGSAWKWTNTHFAKPAAGWADYKFTLSTKAADTLEASQKLQKLYVASPAAVNAVVINLYSLAFTGSMTIDYVALVKKDGSLDTIADFNKKLPTIEGNIGTAKLIATPKAAYKPAGIAARSVAGARTLLVSTAAGKLVAGFDAAKAGMAEVTLLNPQGQVIVRKSVATAAGANVVSLDTDYRGLVLVQVRQDAAVLSGKAVLR